MEENVVVYGGKEFADIALKYPGSACVVARYLAGKDAEAIYCSVCSLICAARV